MHLHLKRKLARQDDAVFYGHVPHVRAAALRELATCLAAQANLQTLALLAALRAEVNKTTEAGRWTAGIELPALPSRAAEGSRKLSPWFFWHARSHVTNHVA